MKKPDCYELEHRVRELEKENARLRRVEQELRSREEAARKTAEKYRHLVENLHEILYILDPEARITYISPNSEKILGYTPDELMGRRYTEIVHPDDLPGRDQQFQRFLSGEKVSEEYRFISKHGQTLWCMINARPVFGEDGLEGLYGILVDITERRQVEEALRRSEERYRTILETIEDGYFEVDIAGNFTFFNDSMCRMLGYTSDELMGMNYRQYMDEEDSRRVYETFNWVYRTGNPCKGFDWKLIKKDGSVCRIENSVSLVRDEHGRPKGFKGIARDVSEREKARQEKRELEAQLRQAQKMEAIGTLAGGIAHDFNNILSAVIGYTELSLQEVEKDTLLHTNLSRVLTAGNRARELVKQILTLSRRGETEFTPVPVVPLVKEALKMLRSTFPVSIEVRESILSDEQHIVVADPTQIHQLIVNLATNAKHSMGDENGVLEIRVQPVTLDEYSCWVSPDLDPGDYVKITVSDTGEGISENNLEKIFEPYFTTREKGVGTGLGLSIVHGIVKGHKGGISVDSEPGRGSSFHVYLPVAGRQCGGELQEKTEGWLPGGKERILFVDDEHFIVEMQQKSLSSLGYAVTASTSGTGALETFLENPRGFDLVITDMTMPDMNGKRLASNIKKIRPDIPVILCTGFGDGGHKKAKDADCFFIKPVDRAKMAKAVRALLDGEKGAGKH